MNRWLVVGLVVAAVALGLPLAGLIKQRMTAVETGLTTPLHEAAGGGNPGRVADLVAQGADVNARDEEGRTPLHLSALGGHGQTSQVLLDAGADANPVDSANKTALDYAIEEGHEDVAARLAPNTQRAATASDDTVQRLKPDLKYPDLEAFEAAIGQPGLLLKSDHLYLFAPKSREEGANVVFRYLVEAYDELYRIVGVNTKYIMAFYNFPMGHPDARGSTSECSVWYGDDNLILDRQEEWTKHRVPHVAGLIEEMAHNFVAATHAQFGWEMMGWTIGTEVTMKVAGNPILQAQIDGTRQGQADAYDRYKAAGCVFPSDLPPNQVDRIHAFILWECEQQYGPSFWPDVFAELRKEYPRLSTASGRDMRYQITIECFGRLPGLNFSGRLRQAQISLVTDVKSLNPTEPGWNRKLQ
jgi:hypothetical protein